jgi:putative membrane protein
MNFLINLFVNGVAVYLTSILLPGVRIDGFIPAILVALVLGLINTFLKPLLLILTLPINILTLGLFTFVINALVIIIADKFIGSFAVSNFWWALIFSLVLSVVAAILHSVTGTNDAA